MSMWLIFFLVCFAGQSFMFYCILRRQDTLLKAMKSEHEQFKVLLRALSARMEPDAALGPLEMPEKEPDISHLSVEEALDAYAKKERGEKPRGGLPDLKF